MQSPWTNRIKLNDRDWSIQCAECERWFEATRSDATFCSPRCRMAYSRRGEQLENFILMTNRIAENVLTNSHKFKRNKRVFEAMLRLQKDINAAVALFEE